MKKVVFAAIAAPFAWSAPAVAQMGHAMPGMDMPGMSMPADSKPRSGAKPASRSRKANAARTGREAKAGATPSPGAQHDMASMPGMDMRSGSAKAHPMPGMDMGSMPGMQHGAAAQAQSIPQTPPPPPPKDYAADVYYDPAVMEASRAALRNDVGGGVYSKVMLNIAEFQLGAPAGYRWDGQAWFGGDINRLVLKSQGEGTHREGLESAEVQVLYSRAIAPYTDLQAGLRYDFKPSPQRAYLTLGAQTLLPYWFDVNGALFLSNEGELLGRVEASYDFLLTQRLVLQPRVEVNLAAQNSRDIGVGAGVSDGELGLRLRYEIRREFAPYVGFSFQEKFGNTARFAKAEGKDPLSRKFVIGLRGWF